MKRIIQIIALVLPATILVAQPTDEKNIGQVTIDVTARYRANIKEAVKISGQPTFADSTTKKINVKYEVPNRPVDLTFNPQPIPPLRISGARLPRLPHNFIKVGMGMYVTPEVELFIGNTRNRDFQWGVRASHFSTQSGVTGIAFDNNALSRNQIGFDGKKLMRDLRFNFGVEGNYNTIRYYGVPEAAADIDSLDYGEKAPGQQYKHAKAYVEFSQRGQRRPGVFRNAGLAYNIMGDQYGALEHDLDFSNTWLVKAKEEDLYIDLKAQYQSTGFDSVVNPRLFLIGFIPHISSNWGKVNFTVGMNFSVTSGPADEYEITADNKSFFFAPYFKISTTLVERVLTFDAGWVGDVNNTSMWDLSQMNPYINPRVELAASGYNKIYANLRGILARNLNYRIGGGYNILRNKALFYRSPDLPLPDQIAGFNVVYDDIKVLNLQGGIEWSADGPLDVLAYGEYNQYNTSTQEHAWHLPELRTGLRLKYTWKEKIAFSTDWQYVGERWAHTGDETWYAQKLDGYLDAQFGVQYYYNDNLNAYLNVTNLLSQNYQEWMGYPVQRIRFNLGLSYKF
ncbi:MAG: hypothetical protein LPK80_09545 [Bacteroidota bacterium]|nr:hypothetical protein [Bacteroidota bacterium]